MMMDSEDECPALVGDAFLGAEDMTSSHAAMTTKIPPAYNGRSSWFAYEELIDEWVDLTTIAGEKQGPNLKNRLVEDAQMYKPLLDRDRLLDPDNGVQYFKDTLRPHFVKGKEHVFLWRFLLFFRSYRGNQDMTRWIGRFIITRKRLQDAWMDLFPEYNTNSERYRNDVQTASAAQVAAGGPQIDPNDPDVFDEWVAAQRRRHAAAFPLNDHLVTMMFIVAADLTESQRERLVSTMSVRGIQLAAYTFDVISQVFREIFCATKTGIADPNLRPQTSQSVRSRSFCVIDEGDWDGDTGLWVQDDETGEEGFVNYTDEIFWTYDDTSAAFVARPTKGRALRRGWPRFQPRKGKGKGSRGRFRSHRKGKGKGRKGKGKGYYGEEDQDSGFFGKGKGKGKGRKGKKGNSQDGDAQGKGKSESLQVKTEPSAKSEPLSNREADSFWSEDTWWTEDVWWTDDSSWGHDQWSSYLVIERSEQTPEHSALLSSFQLIDIRKNPTYVILDSGCTRCLGSRPRVMAFVEACRARGSNMKFQFVPCQTKFSFANSRTARVYERLVIHFDTKPPCKTEIDILEEGTVPILLSIQQMRQLYMVLEHTPECDYLTCKAFGMNRHPLPISNTNHIVLDLAALKQNPRVMLTTELDEDILYSRTAQVVSDESVFNINEMNLPGKCEESQHFSFAAKTPEKAYEDLPVEKRCHACRGKHRPHSKDNRCLKWLKENVDKIEGEKEKKPVEQKAESEPVTKRRISRKADCDKMIVGTEGQHQESSTSSSSSAKPSAHVELPDQGDSSSSRAKPAVSPPEAEEQPPPSEEVLPLAIDRIRQRLESDVELHKLHLKHHHMNTSQFKQRTHALKLPGSIYQRYDEIVKGCEVCQKAKGTPPRSKVSGMRADVFGELLFIDHGEVTESGFTYVFFLILDGATNLVTAFVQKSKEDSETQENLREHMHQLQFRPKAIVGDQAFHTPAWETFYRTRGIKPVSLGPGTPWPNRAEAAVRLFKHQVKLMFSEIRTNPVYKSITPRELFREACWARNVSVTYSGKTPLELAFGRRPPDIIDVETSSLQQLTVENLPADERIKQIQQLAMKCHLQARQAQDLRQDIASSLRFSHGPFAVGDKVWYFEVDPSKIKNGQRQGGWFKAKVIGVDGSMVGIDLGNRIIRVNESKLRKDHDHFGDINVPVDHEISARVDQPPGLETHDEAEATFVQDGSTSFAHVLWQVMSKGKLDMLELFAGSARISQCSSLEGLRVGQPVDLRTGFDLNTSKGQRMTMQLITDQQPEVVFMAPVCAPWSSWSHMKTPEQKYRDRLKVMPMVQFVIRVAKYQLSKGRYFIIENPYSSDLWKLKEFVALLALADVSYGKFDMCAYGMKDPASHDYYYKPTCLVHNFPSGALDPVFRLCPNTNRTSGTDHVHERIEGWCKGHGRRSSLAQVYPYSFCKRLAHCVARFLQVQPHDRHSFLISDILDLCLPSSWCSSMQEALQCRVSGEWEVLSSVSEFGMPDATPIAVSDPVVKKLMVRINSMPANTEILLHNEPWTPSMNELGNMTVHLRTKYLPHHVFGKCSILRGTLGAIKPVDTHDDLAFVIMWLKHDSNKQLYVVTMPSLHSLPSSFVPRKWSMVMFWQETSLRNPVRDPTVDFPMPVDSQPPPDNPGPQPPLTHPVYADPDAPINMDLDQPLPSNLHFVPQHSGSFPPGAPPPGPAPMIVSEPLLPDQPMPSASTLPEPVMQFDPVPSLHDMPPVPHEDEELDLMDDLPDSGQVPLKRPLHPPPTDSPTASASQRLAGELLRPSSPPLPPSPPKRGRMHVRFENSSEEPTLPTLPISSDDQPTTTTSTSTSSSSSSSTPPVSQVSPPVSQKNKKKLEEDDEDEEEPPSTPQDKTQHFRLDEDDEDDDKSDGERTIDYGELVKDLYIDEEEWNSLTDEHKLCSMTGSFSTPRDAYGFAVDVSRVCTVPKTLRNIKHSFQQPCQNPMASKASLDENYSMFTDEDQAMLDLCFEASGLVVKDAAHVASASAKMKKRKEASQTEKRQFAKQFAEAKQAEYQSWVDNNVFDLIDIRKSKCKNYVTGRWVLTIKRTKEGEFQKCKARWVLRGFQDKQKDYQQTDSPAATRPGFRLAAQVAANHKWDLYHIDLKTAFLQGEAYDETRDIICELPKEAGLPWYTCARMKKPAYGLNDAPRRWWNIVDEKLRSYLLEPTRADRCCYVLYDSNTPKGTAVSRVPIVGPTSFDDALNYLLDPVTGSNSKNRKVLGVVCLHVDDLFLAGDHKFHAQVCQNLRKDFSIGSEDKNDIQFVGQRIKWIEKDSKKQYIRVDQHLAIEELEEIKFDKSLKDDVSVTPSMHTEYRSVLGQINWLQSRTQYHVCYKFSRCASQASSPKIGDVRALNKLVRQLKSQPVTLNFWPLDQPCRIIGFPDASYKNNEDKSSQRAHCIFLAASRNKHSAQVDTYGSLVDYESHKITATTMSTTVAELYALMKCFGTCQFIRGLWADLSGESAPIHIRTDANNLVTTASTTHVPEQKETIHLIQMLRKESGSGNIEDLAHVKSEFCLSDALTKHSAKPDELIRAVETGHLRQVDTHPPFRSLLKHKAYLCLWITKFIKEPLKVVSFFGEEVQEQVLQTWYQQ